MAAYLFFVLLLLAPCLSLISALVFAAGYTDVIVTTAKAMIDSDPSLIVLDVRNQSEYDTGHIRNAKLIPVWELGSRLSELNKSDEILVYCLGGGRSSTASQVLADDGFLHVYNMLRGINAWIDAGFPVYVRYDSIQKAVNNAKGGDAVFVASGLYAEHITVNKSVALVGESADMTIVDGTDSNTVFYVSSDNVSISDFTIRNSGCSCAGYCGVYVENYHQNINITSNRITLDGMGIEVDLAQNVFIGYNNITDNDTWGIFTFGSSNILITHNNLVSNLYGMKNENAANLTVSGNVISDSNEGMYIQNSDGNTVYGNTISSSRIRGIRILNSSSNLLFHNNLQENAQHASSDGSLNYWDNGVEGNYWSDYNGTDEFGGPYKNVSGSDGIGDTSYSIDAANIDHYPLMGTFSSFSGVTPPAESDQTHEIDVVSNSTISDFGLHTWATPLNQYIEPGQLYIGFTTSGANLTAGFCRMIIPNAALNSSSYDVLVDLDPVNATILQGSNDTHTFLYFNYTHSAHEVVITPEFPSFLILPLFMIATLLVVTICRRKHAPYLKQ